VQYVVFSFEPPMSLVTGFESQRAAPHEQIEQQEGKCRGRRWLMLLRECRACIYLYQDIVSRLQAWQIQVRQETSSSKFPRHRKAVHSLKWSEDGWFQLSSEVATQNYGNQQLRDLWVIERMALCDMANGYRQERVTPTSLRSVESLKRHC